VIQAVPKERRADWSFALFNTKAKSNAPRPAGPEQKQPTREERKAARRAIIEAQQLNSKLNSESGDTAQFRACVRFRALLGEGELKDNAPANEVIDDILNILDALDEILSANVKPMSQEAMAMDFYLGSYSSYAAALKWYEWNQMDNSHVELRQEVVHKTDALTRHVESVAAAKRIITMREKFLGMKK
jgi:hypothetical protein